MKASKNKWITSLMLTVVASLMLGGSVFAFTDVKDEPEKVAIMKLEANGLLKGNGKGRFNPKSTMDAASAVSLIVRGLDLNIDHIRFIKEPKASDSYTKVKDNAWYANAFIIAQFNGIELPKDIDPNAKVTREQFAKWLFGALSTKGEFAWIEIYMEVADANLVSDGYMDSIQKLLIAKIAVLNDKQAFRPKQPITRAEAAGMVARTIEFIEKAPKPPVDNPTFDVALTSEKLGTEALRIKLTTTVGHPGYGFEVTGIDFRDGKAYVNYRVIMPDPDKMYPQVVTKVTATTIIPASYKPVLGIDETDWSTTGAGASGGSTGLPIAE